MSFNLPHKVELSTRLPLFPNQNSIICAGLAYTFEAWPQLWATGRTLGLLVMEYVTIVVSNQ